MFKENDIIVSLINKNTCRYIGSIIKIIYANKNKIKYEPLNKEDEWVYSNELDTFRLATTNEISWYYQGINNINDIPNNILIVIEPNIFKYY